MYHLFAQAIAFLDAGDMVAACDAVKSANEILKPALKFFFSTMVDTNLSQKVWMAYVQGYQGWTLGGIDGISGGQSLVFRSLDSFLGIRPFPAPEKEALHLPVAQRDWLNFLRDYDIRAVAKAHGEQGAAITAELEALVKQLRVSTLFDLLSHEMALMVFSAMADGPHASHAAVRVRASSGAQDDDSRYICRGGRQ